MPDFRFTAEVTVSATTIISADNEEEAVEIAESRDVEIGGIGSDIFETETWVIEDADGSPQNVKLEV